MSLFHTRGWLSIAGLLFLAPSSLWAHVKWFSKFDLSDQPDTITGVVTPLFIALTVLTIVVLGVLVVLERRVSIAGWYQRVNAWLEERSAHAPLVLRVTMGATLLLSWQQDSVFAPELTTGSIVGWLQFLLAVLLLFPRAVSFVGGALLALFVYCVIVYGTFHMVDYLHYVGIGWYLLVAGSKRQSLRESRIPALYITVGFSLAWLALEKLFYPQWTLYILQQNPQLAFGLDIDFFRVGAAFVELGLAYLFLICLFERPIAALVTVVFMLTTTVFGKVEVIGHTAIHGALIVFLLEGPGKFYRPPIAWHRGVAWRSAFATVNFVVLLAVGLVAYQASAWHVYREHQRGDTEDGAVIDQQGTEHDHPHSRSFNFLWEPASPSNLASSQNMHSLSQSSPHPAATKRTQVFQLPRYMSQVY